MSDEIVIDLGDDEPEEQSFDLLPAGYAKAVAEKVEYKESSKKGTPSIHITWKCSEPAPYTNRLVFDDLWLTNLDNPEKKFNLNRIKNVLKASGASYKGGKMVVGNIIKKIKDAGFVILKLDIEYDATGEFSDKNRVVGYRAPDNPPDCGLGVSERQPPPPMTRKAVQGPPPDDVELAEDIVIEEDNDFLS